MSLPNLGKLMPIFIIQLGFVPTSTRYPDPEWKNAGITKDADKPAVALSCLPIGFFGYDDNVSVLHRYQMIAQKLTAPGIDVRLFLEFFELFQIE
jgi:hypothetical protein